MKLFANILLLCLLLPCGGLSAQDDGGYHARLYTVITKSGDTLIGTFDRSKGDTLHLRGGDGKVHSLRRSELTHVDEGVLVEAGEDRDIDEVAEAFRTTPSSSLLFAPTAWPKPDGHPVVGVYEFAFVSASVSLGPVVTIGGMVSFTPVFLDEGEQIRSLTLKFTPLSTDNIALAGGVWLVDGYPDKYHDLMKMYHATASFIWGGVGLTAGLGLVDADEDGSGGILYLGSEIPVTTSFRILIEVAKSNDNALKHSHFGAAARVQAGRILIDFGVLGGLVHDSDSPIPWLGLAVIL